MTKIDAINAKILKELLKDGRKSFTEIAKECSTSKDVIAKRYKRMKKEGIIVGATIQNSCAVLGCDFIAGISIKTQPHKAEQVLQLINRIPHVFEVYRIGVNPSLAALVTLKTIEELDSVKQSIKLLPFVLEADTRVWTGVRNTPENLSILSSQETVIKTANAAGRTKTSGRRALSKIDETDVQIIEKLAKNGRMPFRKIAEELKISTDTVTRRYEKLNRNGDLKVVIQINPAKIGYDAFAIFNLNCMSQNGMSEIVEAFAKIPDVNFVIKTTGNFDFIISLMIKDIKQLTDVQEEIATMPYVTKIKAYVAKSYSVWPLPREFISTF